MAGPKTTRRGMVVGGTLAGFAAAAPARAVQRCVPDENQRRMMTDFANLGRYADANATLRATGAPVGVVFMGDSITEGWLRESPDFWTPGRVDRGIGGQTTPQMLLRMMQDVIALRPRAVHIMAGTNDVAGNTGPMTAAQTLDNIVAMASLARGADIAVLVGAIPPAARFGWKPEVAAVAGIAARNAMLRQYADRIDAPYIDYHAALATPKGAMRPGMANDGVHPTPQGYRVMEKLLLPRLSRFESA